MTMSFLPLDTNGTFSGTESFQIDSRNEPMSTSALLHIALAKLRIPDVEDSVSRPRVEEMLKSSVAQFPATFVCGRSGTGKTESVAAFATARKRVAWNSLEPPDVHWASFANSTLAAIRGSTVPNVKRLNNEELLGQPEIKDISRFVDRLFSQGRNRRDLLVLDNVHYVFDTVWFREFFELLLPAIPDSRHVILISRSKPPFPLWRMRSKQFLNVIDEKVFAFDEAETTELFKRNGYPVRLAPLAHQNCFGKVAHMLRFAEAAAESNEPQRS
jgi:ATP/maltotriose-dependent transcriptional regulator MalT